MKLPDAQPGWPESWTTSRDYDRLELESARDCLGYRYAYRARRARTLSLIRAAAAPGAHLLDLAAAQGNFSLTLAELGYAVTWNDLRAELVGYVKLKYERGELRFAPGDAFALGFGAEFDVVLAAEIIEHVAHPDRFLRRLAALVKPGGHVVLTTPNGGYFLNRLPAFSACADPAVFEAIQFRPNADGHIFLLHEQEIAPLAQAAGLAVVELDLFTNSLTNGHVKTERVLRLLPAGFVAAIERCTGGLPRAWQRKLCSAMVVLLRKPT